MNVNDIELLTAAYAYKGFKFSNYIFSSTIEGNMYGNEVLITFKSAKAAKTWFENFFNYAVEDAAELYMEEN